MCDWNDGASTFNNNTYLYVYGVSIRLIYGSEHCAARSSSVLLTTTVLIFVVTDNIMNQFAEIPTKFTLGLLLSRSLRALKYLNRPAQMKLSSFVCNSTVRKQARNYRNRVSKLNKMYPECKQTHVVC